MTTLNQITTVEEMADYCRIEYGESFESVKREEVRNACKKLFLMTGVRIDENAVMNDLGIGE